MSEFDETKFNWKKAIFDLTQDMVEVKTNLSNHLRSHRIKDRVFYGIGSGVVIGIIIILISKYAF